LVIAKELDNKTLIGDILLNLGNNARLKDEPEKALEFDRQAIKISSDPNIQLRGKLSILDILVSLKQKENALKEAEEIEQLLAQLPLRQTTIQARVSLARHLIKLGTKPSQVNSILVSAIEKSRELGIKRIESDALGVFGNLYERNQQWQEAEKISERALSIAQNIDAKELTYQWQWQLGRILKERGNREDAIVAYTEATKNLQSLRGDLVAISSDLQYSFREKIEPVYRELAALLLSCYAARLYNLKIK
jgi:tetratricopeptide (TPR) repeat protein